MTPDYTAMKRELPALKAALTRAKKSKDPEKVLAVCAKALARFDEIGYPDCWAMFDRAGFDAQLEPRRHYE